MKQAQGIMRHEALMVAFLVAAALVLRMFYLWEISDSPLFNFPIRDSELFFSWAYQMASGSWESQALFIEAPLYPYLLSKIMKVVGPDILVMALVQVLASAWSCFFGWWLARRFLGARGALLSLLFIAFAPMPLFWSGSLLPVSLVTLVNLVMVCMIVKAMESSASRKVWLVAAGFLFSLSVLMMPVMSAVLPFLLWWIALWTERTSDEIRESKLKRKKNLSDEILRLGRWLKPAMIPFAFLLLGASILLGPLLVRNYKLSGKVICVLPSSGVKFWQGNHDNADGGYQIAPWIKARGVVVDLEEFRRQASRLNQKNMDLPESSSYWKAEALKWMVHHPVDWMNLLVKKGSLFWHRHEHVKNQSPLLAKSYSALLSWLPFSFALIAPLALAGMVLLRRRWRGLFPLLAFVSSVMLAQVLVFNTAEERALTFPFLSILAAGGLLEILRLARAQNSRALTAALLGWALAVIFVSWPRPHLPERLQWIDLARAAERQGLSEVAKEIRAFSQGEKRDMRDKGKIRIQIPKRRLDLEGFSEKAWPKRPYLRPTPGK